MPKHASSSPVETEHAAHGGQVRSLKRLLDAHTAIRHHGHLVTCGDDELVVVRDHRHARAAVAHALKLSGDGLHVGEIEPARGLV